jgi:hypothetical protein
MGVTFHAPGSVGSEEMNPRTPKPTPTFGVGVPMDF